MYSTENFCAKTVDFFLKIVPGEMAQLSDAPGVSIPVRLLPQPEVVYYECKTNIGVRKLILLVVLRAIRLAVERHCNYIRSDIIYHPCSQM